MTWKYHILALWTYKGCYDVCSADDNINALKIFTCKAKLQLDKNCGKDYVTTVLMRRELGGKRLEATS